MLKCVRMVSKHDADLVCNKVQRSVELAPWPVTNCLVINKQTQTQQSLLPAAGGGIRQRAEVSSAQGTRRGEARRHAACGVDLADEDARKEAANKD